MRSVGSGALSLSALRAATAAPSDDENNPSCGPLASFGHGGACTSPSGFLVVLTSSNMSCSVLCSLHCVSHHPISSVMRYCIASSLARSRSVADAMIAFSTLVALMPKVLSAHSKIQEWIINLSRGFGAVSRDKEAQRVIQGHSIHMACQCDFFSMKTRQHVSLPLCQRIELILKGWKDSALVLSQTVRAPRLHPIYFCNNMNMYPIRLITVLPCALCPSVPASGCCSSCSASLQHTTSCAS